jgi:hypothetical protein
MVGLVGVLAVSMTACGGGVTPRSASTTPPGNPIPPGSLSQQYFGMHLDPGVLHGTLPWPTFPFGLLRMNSTETRWSDIDQGNGVYDFTKVDKWLALVSQNQVTNAAGNYQIVFTTYSVPGYISSNPLDPCNYNATSGHDPGSCDPPTDVNADGSGTDKTFTDFITALAQHANGRIHYWEMWNEPNDMTFWSGSLAQMVRMAQDARCVIVGTDCNSQTNYTVKGIDPTAKMLTPSPVTTQNLNPAYNSPAGWMAAYLGAGGSQYADIVGYHGYVGHTQPVENVVGISQGVIQAAGSKPVWDTEIGFSTADLPDPYMEAGWLAKAYLIQPGLGIQTVAWFAYGATNVGTLFVPPSLDAAGKAYGVIYNWLLGAKASGLCSSSGTVWTCNFTLSSGSQAQAVWDSAQVCSNGTGVEICTSANFSPDSVYTKYLDLQGNSHSFASGSTVPIGAEPIFLEVQ